MNVTIRSLLIVALAVCAWGGCETTRDDKPVTAEKLEPYQCGTIDRLHTYGGVFLASQPQPGDFQQAREGGVKTVINLRLPGEVKDFDEAQIVTDLGMQYHNPGFKDPDTLTDDVFDQVRRLLNDPQNKPILLHCSSANRVGTVWLAHRVLDGGVPYAHALAEAKAVGLKLPAYEQKAKDYIDRHQ